jgi:hypothetical protein
MTMIPRRSIRYVEACDKNCRLPLRGVSFRAMAFATLFTFCVNHSSAQSATAPVQTPQQPGSQAAPNAASSKPNASSKPKRVITNEDLEGRPGGGAAAPSNTRIVTGADNSPLLNCESACEQTARAELGYDSDRDAEWQMQIVSARKELIADTEWRQLLSQAIQQTHTYCNFLAQRSQKVSPSGNSFDAQMQRARAEEYFQNMDRTLQQGLNTLTSRINSWIQQVSVLSPVRGAMMNAQASRIFQRNCEFPSPR